jgi:RimJ/RimL family protein N-acetyltransferase
MKPSNALNVAIRTIEREDAEPFYQAVKESVPHVGKWLSWCSSDYQLSHAEDWAQSADKAWQAGSDHRFVIVNVDSGEILGSVGIKEIDLQKSQGDLGYWVRHSALNKGVCTEAARQAAIFAFTKLNLRRIEIHVHPDNEASNAVAIKLGAVFERLVENKILLEGEMAPANCYSLEPSDFGLAQ